ncbi:RNA polymerase II-associated protein 1 [Scaptodrosophila lebanonensis]|uniref:RNA polymerase II-associated protein 1 n=1 Tax=Drosophila lebanonensis TaxID=7225 RepID=A0A6J2TAI2_DROLE|nr:RNA polymerase II-associated protein 1 [Scaptodrosophila lebanonensis]
MFKKLKRGDTEEDVMRMADEFNAERSKNPDFQPAATAVRVEKMPKKSLFAQKRAQAKQLSEPMEVEETKNAEPPPPSITVPEVVAGGATSGSECRDSMSKQTKLLLDDIHENILGDLSGSKVNRNIINNMVGDIVERRNGAPRAAPEIVEASSNKPRSLFAQKFLADQQKLQKTAQSVRVEAMQHEPGRSVIIRDNKLAEELHAENLKKLNQMRMEDILAERKELLNSLDPTLVQMLTNKRKAQQATSKQLQPEPQSMDMTPVSVTELLPESNPAHEILQQSSENNWLHFNRIEDHKLSWMRDIPARLAQLKPGQQFDARFDWKGVLLPHTLQDLSDKVDDRELYLHGEEPERPGYTLQELFRLARSTVLQQRISAFGSIAGILSIYNQGFYDQVLELPISKIFFLLRFGLDDNTHAQLEVVSKALARLCYNETDEVLLDHIYENAYCHWQPTLQVIANAGDETDPTSIAFLQRTMKLLRTNPTAVRADVDEDEAESRMSMDDFQLAETDLMECLLRTNILQRITFILGSSCPKNNAPESCLKILIRLARTHEKLARQMANEAQLLEVLITHFMPPISDTPAKTTQHTFYGQPQYLCLKLWRVLISQHSDIAKQLAKGPLIERLQNYLFYREDIKGKLIRVQLEALRILRCLLLQGIVDRDSYKKFLPALRQLLDWHYNHCVFEVGGAALIRQHASAVLTAIVASGEIGACDVEAQKLMLEPLHNCCCSWIHKATRSGGFKDYSQLTLISSTLYAVSWFSRHSFNLQVFQKFQRNFLPNFVRSPGFIACFQHLIKTPGTIILSRFSDRRNSHAPLPNVGAVLMNDYGPQLVISDTYPVQLLSNVWTLLELQLNEGEKTLFDALMQPAVLEPVSQYLGQLSKQLNRLLATNFFARSELKLIHQFLCTDGIETYLERTHLLQLVYNYLCCLSTSHATQIKSIFERFIFNSVYVHLDDKSLELLRQTCMEMIYPHIIEANKEPTLTLCYTQAPILPPDWPYFQLRLILSNYVQNVQQQPAVVFSEHQVVRMTLTFVQQLESQGLQIVTPLEKLMYLMISFMGPDSQFLDPELHQLLHAHLKDFYAKNAQHIFDFDATFPDKGNFEPLYYLFVTHFQAASYGDELFSSLVLLPLAQKYDNKWRRRLWSEHVQVMRFLNCDENLLIGGLAAYLEPLEEEPSLVKLYGDALERQLVRPGSIAYKIAQHHFNNSEVLKKTKTF